MNYSNRDVELFIKRWLAFFIGFLISCAVIQFGYNVSIAAIFNIRQITYAEATGLYVFINALFRIETVISSINKR
jgi:hypothetical protein